MKSKRQPAILLEVLIAFALIALCFLPLIYPHVVILRSEKKFISTVELDHYVNLLYADHLQKLYQNDIPWQYIENGAVIPIELPKDLPFSGHYQFIQEKKKKSKDLNQIVYIFNLYFVFVPKPGYFMEKKSENLTYKYKYRLCVEKVKK